MLCPTPIGKGAISVAFVRLSICLSVHPSVAYIVKNSSTQRRSMPKFGRNVLHRKGDLHTSCKVKRSKVRVRGGRGHTVSAKSSIHTACLMLFVCIVTVETHEKQSKTARTVVHYDVAEVRKYMKKRREQRRQQCRKDVEDKANTKAMKEQKLHELMERQRQAAAVSAASSRRKMMKLQQVSRQCSCVNVA